MSKTIADVVVLLVAVATVGTGSSSAPAPPTTGGQQITVTGLPSGAGPFTEWSSKAPMATARYFLAGGVVNGILYAVGGYDSAAGQLSSVEAYDPATNSWTAKAAMPTARAGLAVGVVDGVVYAI